MFAWVPVQNFLPHHEIGSTPGVEYVGTSEGFAKGRVIKDSPRRSVLQQVQRLTAPALRMRIMFGPRRLLRPWKSHLDETR